MSRQRLWLIALFLLISVGGSIAYLYMLRDPNIQEYGYKVLRKYKHDTNAFTQGLVYDDGFLYESTGQLGESSIRKYRLSDETTVIDNKLDSNLFGEGLALWNDQFIQLTYQNGIAIYWDRNLRELERRDLPGLGEGWGLTHDGKNLIMSNGTSNLRFLDPETLEIVETIAVFSGGMRVRDLNELEYVNGKIYANVWKRDTIVEIDPGSGRVTGILDLKGILPKDQRPRDREAVLNGIAYIPKTDTFIVTGKNWPYLFEIELVKPN